MTERIIKTSNFKLIADAMKSADKDTLVVFDVDEVLFQPIDQVLKAKFQSFIDNFEKIVHNMSHPLNEVDYNILILLQRHVQPVDSGFIKLISDLQNSHVKVVALTHCISGKFGNIDFVEDWRLAELKKLNYNLVNSWPDLEEKILQIDNYEIVRSLPLFKKGVIFTNGVPKGLVLEAFLKYAKIKPKKVIFVDDLAVNIQSVRKVLANLDIDYIGIEYVAADELELLPLDEQRAYKQLKKLITDREWLSDAEMN